MKTLNDVSMLDVVPYSIAGDQQVEAISAAVSPQLQEVTQAIRECLLLARLDELPENIVDLLAWQYHVDFYEPELTLQQRRNLVRTAIDAHRRKGTPYAVELVVKAILNEGVVQEWFEYGGEPYRFRIVKIDGQMPDAAIYDRLKKAIQSVKNTRSWLDGISLHREIGSTVYVGSVSSTYRKVTILPPAYKMSDVSSMQRIGGVAAVFKKNEVSVYA